MKSINSVSLCSSLIAVTTVLATALPAQAALISIGNAALSGAVDTQILNTGNQLIALNVNGTASAVVNGITFSTTASGVSLGGFSAALTNQAGNETHYTPLGLKEVMGDLLGTNPVGTGTVTFSGLTIGKTYRVQMLHHQDINDSLNAPNTQRDMELHFGNTAGPGSVPFNMGDNTGRITTTLFSATATSQLFSLRTGSNDRAILNGLSLFELVPEVAVSGNGVDIADGDASPSLLDFTDFGTTSLGSPIQRTFRVDNFGQIDLTTSGLSLPTGFSLIEGLSASIAAGAFDTFIVQFDALAHGAYSGNISFTTNDSNENPFNFAIMGSTVPEPGTLILAGLGLVVIALRGPRRKRR